MPSAAAAVDARNVFASVVARRLIDMTFDVPGCASTATDRGQHHRMRPPSKFGTIAVHAYHRLGSSARRSLACAAKSTNECIAEDCLDGQDFV